MFQRKRKKYSLNKGMSYAELIVVLSIFSVMTSIVLFNYQDFQASIDMKNLASDVALKVVEAQKTSLSGKMPAVAVPPSWKPSYGVYFNLSSNKNFASFVDISNYGIFDGDLSDCSGECLNKTTITKNNYISNLDVFYQDNSSTAVSDLTLAFTRPDSGARITSTTSLNPSISYAQITVRSPKGMISLIKLYSSGRIQIN